jgi:hypothetical protein
LATGGGGGFADRAHAGPSALLLELALSAAGARPGAGQDEADAGGSGDLDEACPLPRGVGGQAGGEVGGPLADRPRVPNWDSAGKLRMAVLLLDGCSGIPASDFVKRLHDS